MKVLVYKRVNRKTGANTERSENTSLALLALRKPTRLIWQTLGQTMVVNYIETCQSTNEP